MSQKGYIMTLPTLHFRSWKQVKFLTSLLTAAVLIFGVGAVFAQEPLPDEPWSVYLYNDVEIRQFNADGPSATYNPQTGNSLFASMIAVSPDESRIATCTTAPSFDPNGLSVATLTVHDLTAQSRLFDVALGEAIACEVTRDAFSLDGAQMAVGLITPWPTAPRTPQAEITWQIHLIDTATGEIIHTLDSLSAQSGGLDSVSGGMYLPYIRRVEAGEVIFALVPWFTHGQPYNDAYRWDLATNSITEEPMWGRTFGFGDQILTADGFEFAYTMLDESQPAAISDGPVSPMNTVVVQREGGEPQAVYTNTEELITEVGYINDGNALAIQLLQGDERETEPGYPIQQRVRWIMLTRDGTVTEIVPSFDGGPVDVMAVPDGYLQFTGIYGVEGILPSLNVVTSEGTTNLWTFDPNGTGFNLLYATPPDLTEVSLPVFAPASAS